MTAPLEYCLAAYEAYLKNERCMTERSVRDYLWSATFLCARLNPVTVSSYKEINDVIREMKERENWSQGTVYKYSICVKNFFKWLYRERYRQDNPYPFAEWRKPRPHTPRFLTQIQFSQIVDDPHLTHQEQTILHTFWDSAARLSEVEHLTQDDFFFDVKFFLDDARQIETHGHYVRIRYEISKGNYSYRNVPITETLKEMLKRQFQFARNRGHHQSVFLSHNNEPITDSGISKLLYNIGMRQSPLRPQMHLSAHMFRHSFGIRMLEKDIPQVIVQKWLGHQSLDMTSHYVNMAAENSMRIFRQRLSQNRESIPLSA